jgi:hypothetical protein
MGDEGFTLLLSALAVGTLSGAIVVGLRVPRFPKGRLLIAAALLAGAMLALLSRVDDLVPSVATMLLVGVAAAMVLVPFSTMLQERLGDQVMGTSFGMLAVGLTAPMLVGIGLAGPIIEVWDAGTLFLAMGSMLVVAGLAALPLSSLWSEH